MGIKVIAIDKGHDGMQIRNIGEQFELHDRIDENGEIAKDSKGNLLKAEHFFSEKWMRKVGTQKTRAEFDADNDKVKSIPAPQTLVEASTSEKLPITGVKHDRKQATSPPPPVKPKKQVKKP